MSGIIGKPPIHPAWVVIGKAAVAASTVLWVLGLAGIDVVGHRIPRMRPVSLVAGALGWILLAVSLRRLGRSARVGLPEESTELKTTGVYAVSRNPVYLSLGLICLASVLYVPNWLNLGCAVVAASVHHRIVLAEERFLAGRFGAAWDAYRSQVRRYL